MPYQELATSQEIICHCTCTTRAQIITLINNGIHSLAEISYKTGAAAGCGACESWITDLLAEAQCSKIEHVDACNQQS